MKNVQIIKIRGVRTHNLKNLDLDLKMNQITCIYGPSGSGKTSLAFHTLLTESKRRYINSLPSDMKFFWEIPHTVEVDLLYPVLPAWGLPQHNPVVHSRPVALDILGGHEKLQKIFYFLGNYYCKNHQIPFLPKRNVNDFFTDLKKAKIKDLDSEVFHFFVTKSDYLKSVSQTIMPIRTFQNPEEGIVEYNEAYDYYEVFRLKYQNLETEIEKKLQELKLSREQNFLVVLKNAKKTLPFYSKVIYQCPKCDEIDEGKLSSADALSPLNALGACSECQGHGMKLVFDKNKMARDQTKSLREGALNILSFSHFEHLIPAMLKEAKKNGFDVDVPFNILPKSIWNFLYKGSGAFEGLEALFSYLESKRYKKTIRIYSRGLQSEEICTECAGSRVSKRVGDLAILKDDKVFKLRDFLLSSMGESQARLLEIKEVAFKSEALSKIKTPFEDLEYLYQVACDLGLSHLSNVRKVRSLSSSEYQRILLGKFLSYRGSQSLFVLDEPSMGLSPKTQAVLKKYLYELRDQGNTVVMVEHSEFMKSIADEVIEMGPEAGMLGGNIIYQGKYKKEKSEIRKIKFQKSNSNEWIRLLAPEIRNIKKEEIKILKNTVNLVYGESGSGKSALFVDVLASEIHERVKGTKLSYYPYKFKKLEGAKDIKDVIVINSSIDKVSSRSTVGTYTDLAGFIKKHFVNLEISKSMNLKDGHFSPNSELGMCLSCEGRGVKIVEMHFMEDVEFICEECQGKKLKPFYADISDGVMTAYEAYTKSILEVTNNIRLTPKGKRIVDYLKTLKLDYLSLDRKLASLSGGERQRLYLLTLLDKKIENSLIIFENLSGGLSLRELVPLSLLLHQLCGNQNTVVVIDQNPYFLEVADAVENLDKTL